jgi:hypothetical protein
MLVGWPCELSHFLVRSWASVSSCRAAAAPRDRCRRGQTARAGRRIRALRVVTAGAVRVCWGQTGRHSMENWRPGPTRTSRTAHRGTPPKEGTTGHKGGTQGDPRRDPVRDRMRGPTPLRRACRTRTALRASCADTRRARPAWPRAHACPPARGRPAIWSSAHARATAGTPTSRAPAIRRATRTLRLRTGAGVGRPATPGRTDRHKAPPAAT